ncbi:MAG: hypothetical protein B0D92_01255 [Spirochaeta sp. LUC14_002_19_P3]|nr:MAG: hypothetical protein B0D92_01255 [Spirochaeta sp. LUC14_002_19_P3]
MAFLKPEGRERIGRCIEKAEKNTSGEIATAIIPESDDYKDRELLAAIVCGVIAYILLVIFSDPFARLLDKWSWFDSPRLLPLSMLTVTLLTGSLSYALAQIPALDRLIVGRRVMAEAVRNRALRHFVESAVYDTIDRTGVLLFISVLERRVELIADKGISAKVDNAAWESIVGTLVKGIQEKRIVEALEEAIASIGAILAEHVPPRPSTVNELSNLPADLEKGS